MLGVWMHVLELLVCWYLAGVLAVIHFVHYPLMSHVPASDFPRFEKRHTDRMGGVVGPAMVIELGLAWTTMLGMETLGMDTALPLRSVWVNGLGLGLLLIIWGVTFGVSVPCHRALLKGWDASVHRRLCRTNTLRLFAWWLRALLLLWATWEAWQQGAFGMPRQAMGLG